MPANSCGPYILGHKYTIRSCITPLTNTDQTTLLWCSPTRETRTSQPETYKHNIPKNSNPAVSTTNRSETPYTGKNIQKQSRSHWNWNTSFKRGERAYPELYQQINLRPHITGHILLLRWENLPLSGEGIENRNRGEHQGTSRTPRDILPQIDQRLHFFHIHPCERPHILEHTMTNSHKISHP